MGEPKNPLWVTVTSEPATTPMETSFWRSSAGQLLMAEIIALWPTLTELKLFSSLIVVVTGVSTVISLGYDSFVTFVSDVMSISMFNRIPCASDLCQLVAV